MGTKIINPYMAMTKDGTAGLIAAMAMLTDTQVMVGIPAVANKRGPGDKLNNAEIGYIHEHGAPEAHIPARPHLRPAIAENRAKVASAMKAAATIALKGDTGTAHGTNAAGVDRVFNALGLQAVSWVKAKLVAGVAPPLAMATVQARIRRRKSGAYRAKKQAAVQANVSAGKAPGEGLFTPLIDTGDYMAHITYVLRSRHTKRDRVVGPFRGK
jgi:hypothetical protein